MSFRRMNEIEALSEQLGFLQITEDVVATTSHNDPVVCLLQQSS